MVPQKYFNSFIPLTPVILVSFCLFASMFLIDFAILCNPCRAVWVSSLWGSSKDLCALLAVARCFSFLICYDSGVHKVIDFVAYN